MQQGIGRFGKCVNAGGATAVGAMVVRVGGGEGRIAESKSEVSAGASHTGRDGEVLALEDLVERWFLRL